MPLAIEWTADMDANLLAFRYYGVRWEAIAAALQVSRNTAIERARRLGIQAGEQRCQAQTAPVDEISDRRSSDSGWALPPGDPATWGPITRQTCLAGCAYAR